MNIYDFDHTIYRGDCTLDFWLYCVKKHPIILQTLPRTLITAVRLQIGKCGRETFKSTFYGFLQWIPNIENDIESFWECHLQKIMPWYLKQKRPNDLIISASPDFLISVACTQLGVRWLASPVDKKTGCLLGANCRGEEKVRRLLQEYPQAQVESFYSDSISDAPLAELAKDAYIVKKGVIRAWRKNE